MTIADVKKKCEGEFVEMFVFKPVDLDGDLYFFNESNFVGLGDGSPDGDYTEDMEVDFWELMDEKEFNDIIEQGYFYADFADWYGDKSAKVLCIMIETE